MDDESTRKVFRSVHRQQRLSGIAYPRQGLSNSSRSAGSQDDLVRIVDEGGEDYLYHKDNFVFVDFPSAVKKKILALQGAA